ncbi:MAG: DivIVA domain-containing protein [Ornithinimicrobium sp.]|uniref:DivIVA domain-containing protein n=1 Tax=Ornithinimicrobium sp. TaxID=1977084 RepID=UPI003D9AC02A
MALSPEDVIKKSFKSTKLKRGYQEQEVDDFLDEIVVELRRLGAENASLSSDLADCRASKGLDPHPAEAAESGSGTEAEQEEVARLRRERDELVAEIDELSARAQQRDDAARSPEQVEGAVLEPAGAPEGSGGPGDIISLAQRVHDEHIAEGQSTKARLIEEAETYRDTTVREADERNATLIESAQVRHDELVTTGQTQHDELVASGQLQHDELVGQGQATHDRLVSEGEQTRDQMVGEAEQRRANVLADLGAQQGGVNATIEELKSFESDYRGRLRALLTEQMQILDRDARAT